MLINAVCKECSLTKKAIEYYIEQNLISPVIQNNGYRDFSVEDITKLKKISVLRNLGLSVNDIRNVLSSNTATALDEIYHKKALQMTILQEKQKLIQELAAQHDWEKVEGRLQQLQKKQTILERLMDAFPGFYGKFLYLHFAPYLNKPIRTKEQQKAFDIIIRFLDSIDFDIPDDLKKFLDEVSLDFDDGVIENLSDSVSAAVHETEEYMADNHEAIKSYIAYKQSEEYKTTPAYQMEKALHQFNDISGYNDIFIPAMCQLSEDYQKYHEKLSKANEKFAERYSVQK